MWVETSKRVVTKAADDIRMQGVWSTVAISMIFFMLMAITLTGCQAEESYCYTGINARNAPRHFVVVERADEATHYVPDAEDERLTMLHYLPFPLNVDAPVFDEEGRLQLPWPSCQNADAFDEVTDIHMREIVQENSEKITADEPAQCEALLFSADTNVHSLQLEIPVRPSVTGISSALIPHMYFIVSKDSSTPPLFNAVEKGIQSWVSISHIAEDLLDHPEEIGYIGRKKSEFVKEGAKGGPPPFILVRIMLFYGEAEKQAADLYGKEEMEAAEYVCGDLYYGYFAEK